MPAGSIRQKKTSNGPWTGQATVAKEGAYPPRGREGLRVEGQNAPVLRRERKVGVAEQGSFRTGGSGGERQGIEGILHGVQVAVGQQEPPSGDLQGPVERHRGLVVSVAPDGTAGREKRKPVEGPTQVR
jgi:hypothetical protein